ncbi:hypothetical protein [Acrocarpospora sp. B8E8]|uniref:hypothetical protein n=1 Tax=Acrocarpospora sp. B8E8 TaxID=3153572 RepID=UPI00325D6442
MGDLVTTSYTTLRRDNWWSFLGLSILIFWAAPVLHTPGGGEIAFVELGSVPVAGWPSWARALLWATCLLAFLTGRSPSRLPPLLIIAAAPAALTALLVTVITAVTQLHATPGYAAYFLPAALLANAVVAVPAARKDIPMPAQLLSEENWDYDGTNGTDAQPYPGTPSGRDHPGTWNDRGGPRVM